MSIACPRCTSPNPDAKKYCGDCGAFLAPAAVEPNLRQQIQEALKEQFRDQKVVEIETTQAIATRFSEWLKILGFFLGIPLALLALLLGIMGVRTYSDFSALVKNAQQDTAKKLQQAQNQAAAIKKESDALAAEYQKLRAQLERETARSFQQAQQQAEAIQKEGEDISAEYGRLKAQLGEVSTLSQEVKKLSTTVTQLAEVVGFKPSPALTVDLEGKLRSSFASYQDYLQKLGYRSKTGKVDVYVDPKLKNNAYYDGDRNLIVLGEPFVGDTDVVFREYTHHALGSVAGGETFVYSAIESGLADYFPCSFSGDPRFGEVSVPVARALYGKQFAKPYIRNLENSRSFSELTAQSLAQDAGEIWGGAFWEIRRLLGKEPADRLLFSTWQMLPIPSANLARVFVEQLLNASRHLQGDNQQVEQIRAIFERRGLQL